MSGLPFMIPVDPSQMASRFSSHDYEDSVSFGDLDEEIEQVPDDAGVASYLAEEDFEQKILPLLKRIPEREADLIELYYIHRKRQADIAAIFEVTQAAISYRLERGLQRIKFLLSIPEVTEENMRSDLGHHFEAIDVDILVGMWRTTCQSEVATLLDLTQGRVRHRFFNAVKRLENLAKTDPQCSPYQIIFSTIAAKNFNVLKEVKLPQWSHRGKDTVT
jgi:DNA-directed RNA polymerase specialized sigma24 family protein